MARIQISNDSSGRIIVSFPYDPLFVAKVKTIDGRRWHPVDKHWSFPNKDGILEKILKVFEDQKVQIDPALKGTIPDFVVSPQSNDLRTNNSPTPPLEKGGEGGFESGLSPKFAFEDLRRELVSRKYSHKTVKGYIYYNGAIRNELAKMPLRSSRKIGTHFG
jgi:hypothetical protein